MARLITLSSFPDERGMLLALEDGQLPFAIRRVYYMFDVPSGARRGGHAHRKEEALAVCLRGSCRFLLDDGALREEITLSDPGRALYLPNWTWLEMFGFSPDCLLMVLSGSAYDSGDYIRDYREFLSILDERRRTL